VHRFASNVVGGIENPRFLLVGPELSPNRSFEDDLTGVTDTGSASARETDTTTPFGDYVLTIEDDASGVHEYAQIAIDTGAAISGNLYIALAHGRNDADAGVVSAWCIWQGLTGDLEKHFNLDQDWKQAIVHEVRVPTGSSGNTLNYRIYPFAKIAGNSGEGKIRIDNFRCRKIVDYFELPLPSRGNERHTFRKEYQAQNQLINGDVKSYLKGIRYFYEASYERLTAAQEIIRSKLMNTSYDILFFPHKDSHLCYFVEWDDDYERNWSYGVAPLGHEGQIVLKGMELLNRIPTEVVDATSEYESAEDALIWEGEEFIYTT